MNIQTVTKKNGQTVYRTSIYLGIDQVTGKKARTTVTAPTKSALKVKVREAINTFEKNGYTTKKKTTVTTYKDLVELWWDSYKHTVKLNTKLAMQGILKNYLLPAFGEYKLERITTPVIQAQINKWADQANNDEKGAFQNYSLLNSMNTRILQYGVAMQAITVNPAREVILPRKKQKAIDKVKHLDNQELKQFLNYLETLDQSDYLNLYDVTLYKLLLATGLRIGEATALEWADIDLENQTITISKTLNRYGSTNSPKSQSGVRVIDIDKATALMLKHYHNRQRLEAMKLATTPTIVFTNLVRPYPCPSSLRKRLGEHFQQAKVTNVGFHGFRHTHASLLLNSGLDYKEIQHRLGHSSIGITMNTYAHLSKEKAKKAVSFFENAINNL